MTSYANPCRTVCNSPKHLIFDSWVQSVQAKNDASRKKAAALAFAVTAMLYRMNGTLRFVPVVCLMPTGLCGALAKWGHSFFDQKHVNIAFQYERSRIYYYTRSGSITTLQVHLTFHNVSLISMPPWNMIYRKRKCFFQYFRSRINRLTKNFVVNMPPPCQH